VNFSDAFASPAQGKIRNLLVRVAGYSDYFVDLDLDHQEEIIHRNQHDRF
jgi:formate C-acetyltransferase